MTAKRKRPGDELSALANVGPATRADFAMLGIETVAALAVHEPDELYVRLNALKGVRQDPCVWDVFAATIHQARTGVAAPWWNWTAERKRRQTAGDFPR